MNQAEQLRALAHQIENQPQAREAIAAGFRLVADAMDGKPCTDCASQQGQALEPADKPEAGADTSAPAGADLVDTAKGQF